LIIFSSGLDFLIGKKLSRPDEELDSKNRKFWLFLSLFCNLGLLGVFKYYNFFAENFVAAFRLLGNELNLPTLQVILPVGISFYTFQTLSYSIDVYRRKIEHTNDLPAFFAFVSFFPQLVAGPIERAKNLLPQFEVERRFDYAKAVDGLRQMLWGFFKKIVVADQCGIFVNDIFANYETYKGSTIFLGSVFFAFQIYGDFSGYSDIAIGTSRLFGFNLTRNFAFPYFSRDIAEFWRRWHISLTTWFRDYVYIPLGGSRGTSFEKIRNTFIVFLVSGFWHGANWTFIAWGALNAAYFMPLLVFNKNRKHIDNVAHDRRLPSIADTLRILLTFFLVSVSWIFFRSQSIGQALICFQKVFSADFFTRPEIWPLRPIRAIVILLLIEWLQRNRQHGLEYMPFRRSLRWLIYLTIAIICLANFSLNAEFIYFQF
jgi:D-alanyl-lipoteichoic acid acyltransferase DltB (MBOAT superfamily)